MSTRKVCNLCGVVMDRNLRHSMLVLYHPYDDNVVWDLCDDCAKDVNSEIQKIFKENGRTVKLDGE